MMVMIVARQALAGRVGRHVMIMLLLRGEVMIMALGYLMMIAIIVVLDLNTVVMMIFHHEVAEHEMFVIFRRSGDMLHAVYRSRRRREVEHNQKPDAKRRRYPLL